MRKIILVSCFILMIFTSTIQCENEKMQSDTESKGSVYRVSASGIEAFGDALGTKPVDMNFNDTDIIDVLKMYSYKIKKNIIFSPNISGQVTLRLKQVPFNEAFEILMDRMNLFAINKSPSVIEIVKRDELAMQRETYYPSNRFAIDIKKTLDKLLTENEKKKTIIAVDESLNALVVTSSPHFSSKIAGIIKKLDKKLPVVPQISIKARLVEVQVSKYSSFGIAWANSINMESGDVDNVRVVKDIGALEPGEIDGQYDADETIRNYSTGGAIDISAVIGDVELYSILNMIASDSDSETISEPTIIAENNKSAKIHVGQSLPIKTTQITETGTTQTVEYIPEGVDLTVLPVVYPGSSKVSLKVKVNVSEFVAFQADSPITAERYAETEVVIGTGNTVVIGGLMKEKNIISDSGIPILKDIPLIGYIFKNKSISKLKTELLVFLTPVIIYN